MLAQPTVWSPDKNHSDRERWICIYPAYLNSKKTIKEGRRVPKDKAVENPTHQEIRDVLSATGMKVGVENKLYPRERSKEMLYRGRLRVQLKDDQGKPLDPAFPTRESVMLHICSMIPKLKARQGKPGSDQSGPSKASQPSTSSKKKGKGRR
ncbi:Signal recognition particle 19 kDa [Nesidiocoris tenuis]|uniref:Signal recognition particle 19 kDa n=1 Tax=Nesidiocoris tenuis TaxID=355587 RepID=A0ABN7AXA3_9HEMI|nr:Signal recognition particle 19 kDa [Nesidiocoris tenuis]